MLYRSLHGDHIHPDDMVLEWSKTSHSGEKASGWAELVMACTEQDIDTSKTDTSCQDKI